MKGNQGNRSRSGHLRTAAAMVLAQSFITVSLPAMAAGGDNVYLHGALVAEPCIIKAGDEVISIGFVTIIDKYLYQNIRTQGKTFELHLENCDLTLGKSVRVKFTGTESRALPGLLALDGSSEAKGIAIGFETPAAKPLALNEKSDKLLLLNGGNIIALRAYVKAEPDAIRGQRIERGSFSAVTTFQLEYE